MEYAYIGYTEDRKVVKGKIEAISEVLANEMLSGLGYNVINLKPITRFVPDLSTIFKPKVKTSELVTFSRQLSLLLQSGVSVIRCLELLHDQSSDAQLKKVIDDIVPDLRAGSSLAESMEKHPEAFSKMYSRLVEVGERTGSLDTVLNNLANYAERESKAIAKIKNALTYPIIVGVLAMGVGLLLITFVLPPIVNMFKSLGGDLPLITKMLIAFTNFFSANFVVIFGVIIGTVVGSLIYFRTPTGNFNWNRIQLKMPLIGRIAHISELARLCRSMSLLFRAGLPVNDIINMSAQSSTNKVVARALNEVGQEALEGKGLSHPMTERPQAFLPLMTELTSVGEETGNLEETLIMIAENYEAEADIKTQKLLSLIEPTMTIAMGIVVGFLALSIFMPLYGSLQYVK
jgi:type IV pilus assembly protein PilC